MKTLSVLTGLVALVLFGAFASYVGGRIVLPEVGLTAPEYVTWVWAWLWGSVLYIPIYVVKAIFESL